VAEKKMVIVAGMGEIGRPLLNILSRSFDCIGIDIDPVEIEPPVGVLHICYPYQIPRYVRTTADYIRRFQPELAIIHSTVPPGTTRQVQLEASECLVAFSPVRGKHARMEHDMLHYKKFVAAPRQEAVTAALGHFFAAGLQTAIFSSPEVAELAKLLETSYLGMLVAWAQEEERLAARFGGSFDEVNSFVGEIAFLPAHIFPGEIGGHCVLPNIDLLLSRVESPFLDLIVESNQLKLQPAQKAA
jgi:UDP-N-acetyl-D-mannosaminuronate dehydrogenase